jgi:hypothetical protein
MTIMVVSLLVHTLAQRSRDPFLAYWLIAVVHYLPLARWHIVATHLFSGARFLNKQL